MHAIVISWKEADYNRTRRGYLFGWSSSNSPQQTKGHNVVANLSYKHANPQFPQPPASLSKFFTNPVESPPKPLPTPTSPPISNHPSHSPESQNDFQTIGKEADAHSIKAKSIMFSSPPSTPTIGSVSKEDSSLNDFTEFKESDMSSPPQGSVKKPEITSKEPLSAKSVTAVTPSVTLGPVQKSHQSQKESDNEIVNRIVEGLPDLSFML